MNINQIKEKWINNINPDTWKCYDICLSAICSLFLKNIKPIGIVVLAPSSAGKSTVFNMFKKLPDDMTYYTDKFTAASFLTQAAQVKKEDLDSIDLIRKIPNKLFLVPDFAPFIGQKQSESQSALSTLTRVMDGQGLKNDGGIQGSRQFEEECIFVLITGAVRIRDDVMKMISQMGTRLLFLQLPEINLKGSFKSMLLKQLDDSNNFFEDEKLLQETTNEYLSELLQVHKLRSLNNRILSEEFKIVIVGIAELTSKLRTNYDKEKGILIQEEFPSRIMHQFKNIANGRAIAYKRNEIVKEDIQMVLELAISSIPNARGQILKELIHCYPNFIKLNELVNNTNYKETKLKQELDVFKEVGLIEMEQSGNAHIWKLNESWIWLKEYSETLS